MLREMLSQKGAYHRIVDLVEYLVTRRGEAVGLIHFDALVRANADPMHGSAQVVGGLLEQMRSLKITGDSGFYQGVLLVGGIPLQLWNRGWS
jgi:hypothetical protein